MNKSDTAHKAKSGAYIDEHSKLVRQANNRFMEAIKKHMPFVEAAASSEDFVFGEQWSKDDREENEANGKPCLTINISLSTLNAIYTEYSKLKSDITTKSTGSAVHDESVLLNKTIRNVMEQNHYSDKEADFFLDGITSGRAWVSPIISDDVDPLGEIVLKFEDYNNIVLSPDAAEYDPVTWPELFYFDEYTREEIREEFGEKVADSIDYSLNGDIGKYDYLTKLRTFGEGDTNENSHGEDNNADYDSTIIVTREYYEYANTYTFVDDNTSDYEILPTSDFDNKKEAVRLAKESNLSLYETRSKRIKFVSFCGSVMVDKGWLPYEYYSKIPFFAYFSRGRTMGVMDNIKSPQQQLNKAESQELHIVNSTSNGGWQMEEDTLVNMTPEELERKGAKTGLVLVRRRGAKPMEKIYPNQVPTGVSNLGNKATSHLMRVAGVNDAMMGITKTNDSGNLFENKKDVGQGLLQRIFDNLRRTQNLVGRSVVSLIQNYYTEPRLIRYAAADGELTEEVAINQVNAANRIVNDVTVGRYETVVTWAPKADVLNDYEMDKMLRMREAGFEIPDWMIVDKSQLTNKKVLVDQLRRQAGLDKTPEEQQMEQMMQQIGIKEKQLELQELESKINVNIANAAKLNADAQDTAIGQNKRFLIEQMGNKESDQLNAGLRSDLANKSHDTAITKTMLTNNAKAAENPQLGEF
jgi:hypothetical protein